MPQRLPFRHWDAPSAAVFLELEWTGGGLGFKPASHEELEGPA